MRREKEGGTEVSLRVAYLLPEQLRQYVGPVGVWGDVNDILQENLEMMKVGRLFHAAHNNSHTWKSLAYHDEMICTSAYHKWTYMHIVTAVRWSVCMKPMEKTSVFLRWSHKVFTLAQLLVRSTTMLSFFKDTHRFLASPENRSLWRRWMLMSWTR